MATSKPKKNAKPDRAALPNRGRTRRQLEPTPSDDSGKRRGTGRTSRGRETRERLLESAQAVFERDGFLRARITDICDHAGLSHGSFYTYFFSKEEVFHVLVDTVELDLLSGSPGAEDRSPVERIRDANRHYLEVYRRNAGILTIINQVASFDEEVMRSRAGRHAAFAHAIEKRIRRYQRDGIADKDLDPLFTANALGGMVTAMAEQMFVHGRNDDMEHGVDQLTRLWGNALGLAIPSADDSLSARGVKQ